MPAGGTQASPAPATAGPGRVSYNPTASDQGEDTVDESGRKSFVIDEPMFVVAFCIKTIGDLKELGLVGGGPEMKPGVAEAILVIGKSMGFSEPSQEDVENFLSYTRRGGDWEKEFCASEGDNQ
jgi:hypothetical protein